MPKEKIIRVNTALTAAQKEALDRLQEQTGAPLTWQIQRAVDMYLESRKKELK